MSNFIPLVYSTIGGVLGAGLTQYLTHIRDRRAARALIIERLYDVEAVFARSRWPGERKAPADKVQTVHASLEQALAVLESACLIAGVPRPFIGTYRAGCMLSANITRTQLSLIEDLNDLERAVEDTRRYVKEHDVVIGADAEKTISEARELVTKTRADTVRWSKGFAEMQASADHVRQAGLILLYGAIWHPYTAIFHRRKVADFGKQANELEKSWKDELAEIRKTETIMAEAKGQWLSARARRQTK